MFPFGLNSLITDDDKIPQMSLTRKTARHALLACLESRCINITKTSLIIKSLSSAFKSPNFTIRATTHLPLKVIHLRGISSELCLSLSGSCAHTSPLRFPSFLFLPLFSWAALPRRLPSHWAANCTNTCDHSRDQIRTRTLSRAVAPLQPGPPERFSRSAVWADARLMH